MLMASKPSPEASIHLRWYEASRLTFLASMINLFRSPVKPEQSVGSKSNQRTIYSKLSSAATA